MASQRDPLSGSLRAGELAPLVLLAEQALRTWTPTWSAFLDGGLLEEAEARLAALQELSIGSSGGHAAAERRRLVFQHSGAALPVAELDGDFAGLEIAGNFLFDPADPADFSDALEAAGARPQSCGDLWIRGDRGAQAIVDSALAASLDGREGLVRSVTVRYQARPISELQPPPPRLPRSLSTVEASCRLDAVASAGFGLSRSRMVALIRQGAVRVDWLPVNRASRELAVGERVQLQGRGELRIESVEPTRRERYRIRMERR